MTGRRLGALADAITGHYLLVATAVTAQVAGRQIIVDQLDETSTERRVTISDEAELARLIAQGALALSTDDAAQRGQLVLRLMPGAGSDLANAATAAMLLLEALQRRGIQTVTLTDGHEGLWLITPTGSFGHTESDVEAPRAAMALAVQVAEDAPELLTLDPADADGRAWLDAGVGDPGVLVPVPYSLVRTEPGVGVIAPLHRDELAAVTAGMPLDVEMGDLSWRLARYGDIALGLTPWTPSGG